MSNPVPYKPLGSVGTRGGLDLLSPVRVRLYLGPDHLLLLEKSLGREHYRRLYFRDIEALVWVKTKTWIWTTLLMALPFLLFSLLTILALGTGAEYFLGFLAALLLVLMLENLRRGRTCRVDLKTPAQYVELSSIKRVKQAVRLLELLRPLIRQHQAPAAPATTAPPPATPTSSP